MVQSDLHFTAVSPKKYTHITIQRLKNMDHVLLVIFIAVVIITATVASGPIGLIFGTLFFLYYLPLHTIAAWVIVLIAFGVAL